jgi:hypothetical protein
MSDRSVTVKHETGADGKENSDLGEIYVAVRRED